MPAPYLNQRINLSRKVEKLLRNPTYAFIGMGILERPSSMTSGSSMAANESLVVKTVSSGPSGNLFYLLGFRGTLYLPVKFACFHKTRFCVWAGLAPCRWRQC